MKQILILAALLAGCAKDPEATQQVNAQFKVDTLFTKDGCTVYRFSDDGRYRYFTNCRGNVAWKEGCGKNCTHDVEVSGGAH
jgi:hypothetical protein